MQSKLKQLFDRVAKSVLCSLLMVSAYAAETITYFHNDIVGSPVIATDASGAVVWKETYEPFGGRLKAQPGSEKNAIWFSGKPQDVETGFVYMGARYYDPMIGRFTGVDPAAINVSNVHSANRYAYANNNPYVNKDPDGRAVETAWDAFNLAMGATSFVQNIRDAQWGAAALDAAGLIVDGVATAVPGVPGGAGAGIKALRGTDEVVEVASRARRNGHLAGQNHPVTGIPFDKMGYPDFSGVSKADVKIKFSGNRARDARAANKKAGYDETPDDYVWHHHQDGETMQLIPKDIHSKTGHDGGHAGK